MQIRKILIHSFAFMGTVTLAVAAETPIANLTDTDGRILVDHGKGFAIPTGQTLKVGDRIFVGENSSTVVAYAACSVKLDKPTVFVVGKIAPCAKGADSTQIGSVVISPAVNTGQSSGGIGTVGSIGLVALPLVVGGGLLLLTTTQTVSKP